MALIEKARYNQRITQPVYIAYDEWNVWFRDRSTLQERYTLADALAVATYVHALLAMAMSSKWPTWPNS